MDKERIRPIAICLFRYGQRVLVFEGYDAVKQDYYCRPLGGGIEFGEHSRDAVRREVREELGAEIERVELLCVLENIFVYEGKPGHEVVFVYDAEFTDKALYEREELQGYQVETETGFSARWLSLAEMKDRHIRLVPEGLTEFLCAQNK
jgi:ADP-ribose pyrophosphatase YjhB (NUDIX family)